MSKDTLYTFVATCKAIGAHTHTHTRVCVCFACSIQVCVNLSNYLRRFPACSHVKDFSYDMP